MLVPDNLKGISHAFVRFFLLLTIESTQNPGTAQLSTPLHSTFSGTFCSLVACHIQWRPGIWQLLSRRRCLQQVFARRRMLPATAKHSGYAMAHSPRTHVHACGVPTRRKPLRCIAMLAPRLRAVRAYFTTHAHSCYTCCCEHTPHPSNNLLARPYAYSICMQQSSCRLALFCSRAIVHVFIGRTLRYT